MKTRHHSRAVAVLALSCLIAAVAPASNPRQSETQASAAVLLARARTLEARGRLDLAAANWNQVLTQEPNQPEALAGLVRAARAAGRPRDAAVYLARLQASHPEDPALAQLGVEPQTRDTGSKLRDAERLASVQDYQGAMVELRDLYGATPPPGPAAVLYYETESQITATRPQAIAGLRALADKYPADKRYSMALGKVLLQNARTADEGQTLLDGFSERGKPRSSVLSENTPTQSTVSQLGLPSVVQATKPPAASAANHMIGQSRPPQMGAVSRITAVARPRSATLLATDTEGFTALNTQRYDDAERAFDAVLAQDDRDAKALAGKGYVEVHRGDFRAAVRSFEQAQENGDHSLALTRALVDAQFELALQRAAQLQRGGNPQAAIAAYQAATAERPNNPDALDGLGTALLSSDRPAEAISVFRKLTQVRPLSPAAWTGLMLAQARTGQVREAQMTYARVPTDVRAPLQEDSTLQKALSGTNERAPVMTASARPSNPPPSSRQQSSIPPPVAAPPTKPASAVVPQVDVAHADLPGVPGEKRPLSVRSQPVAPATPRRRSPAGSSLAKVAPPSSLAGPPTLAAAPAPPPTAENQQFVVARERREQASVLFREGEYARAADLYRDAVAQDPRNADAWRGLVLALHRAGRNAEAAAVLPTIAPEARPTLDADASLQVTVGGILAGAGRPGEALQSYARAQTIYASQHLQPPLDLELRIATLLATRNDDLNLYPQLIYLGNRTDMSDEQRRAVQMIWTEWATRRARLLSVAGDRRRAVTLLNAAAEAFSGNARVLAAVAAGYAGIGLPREAVALYRSQDLKLAPATEIESAVSAAIAARDKRDADQWVRLGRERFPNAPEMLNSASELEQYRGHEGRAEQLSAQAKALAPVQDPSRVLLAEMHEGGLGAPTAAIAGKLSVLLAPSNMSMPNASRPYLPSASGLSGSPAVAPVPMLVSNGQDGRSF